jgi:spermidine/putrescine-binding protein
LAGAWPQNPESPQSPQVKVFSNTDHVRAMASGDITAVVGWSEDLLGLRATTVTLAVPRSGTALWADLWCVPAQAAGG